MTKQLAACGALVVGLLFASASGVAHHPIAPEFDAEGEITLEGTVEAFEWKSPHSTLELRARDGDETRRWTIELDGENVLDSLGWTNETLKPGQRVTVMAWPARSGAARAVARSVRIEGGEELAAINPHDPAYAAYASQHAGQDVDASRAANEVTVVGCVELESDYRRRTDAGRGGLLGTGIGTANEFVLVDARPAPPELTPSGPVGTTGDADADRHTEQADARGARDTADGAVGTSGGSDVFTLTGDQEQDLARAVGRQVHIVGVIENPESEPGAAERVRDLPRIDITVWHPVNDFCPAPQ